MNFSRKRSSVFLDKSLNLFAESEFLDHGHSLAVDGDLICLDLGASRHNVVASLAFFLLKLKRDSSDGALLDASHQVGGVSGNLVSESLGADLGGLVDHSFVDVEVQSQPG